MLRVSASFFNELGTIRTMLKKVVSWFNQLENEMTYHQTDDSSNTLTSVNKTRSLYNLFVFRESEKSLKITPLEFFMFESIARKSNKLSSNQISCFNQSMKNEK